jgi:hypothetical protein
VRHEAEAGEIDGGRAAAVELEMAAGLPGFDDDETTLNTKLRINTGRQKLARGF